MSRDAYSYDPQDAREPRLANRQRPRASRPNASQDGRERSGGGAASPVSYASPRHLPLKLEHIDTPRAFFRGDQPYLLRDSEVRSLAAIGTFRVVTPSDLAKYAYDGDSGRMERNLRRLKRESLVTDQTIEVSRKNTLRVVTLTARAHRLLRRTNLLAEEQATYHGLAKPKEAAHDTALYRLYQKEAARIERAGGRPVRVILDYELKRHLNRELAQLAPEEENDDERQRIAERHGLTVIDGKIQLPDLRIEYETADLEPRHIDLDLVTRDYRPQQISDKARAGFALYSPADDTVRLRRILNDRELTAEILSL